MSSYYREDRSAWWVDFTSTLPDGTKQRVREPANGARNAADAQKYERGRRKAILDAFEQAKLKPVVTSPTFLQWRGDFMNYAANNTRESSHRETEQIVRVHLAPRFDSMRLDEITAEVIEAYKTYQSDPGRGRYGRDLSRKTINNQLIVLSRMLHLAVEWKRLGEVPKMRLFAIPKKGAPSYLDFEEARRFVAAAGGTRWETMVVVGIRTGLRIGELLALKWSDVDLPGGKLHVRRRVYEGVVEEFTKNGDHRTVALSATARQALSSHVRHLSAPWVFCEPDGSLITYSAANNGIDRVSIRAKLGKRVSWHDLRHTFASHLTMLGKPLRAVQLLLGHSDLSMTTRYAHLAPATMSDVVDALDQVG